MRACEGKVVEMSKVRDLHIHSSCMRTESQCLDLIGSVEAIDPHGFLLSG